MSRKNPDSRREYQREYRKQRYANDPEFKFKVLKHSHNYFIKKQEEKKQEYIKYKMNIEIIN